MESENIQTLYENCRTILINTEPISSQLERVNNPQLKARGFFVALDHPELGRIISDVVPIKLSQSQAQYHCVAPAPGQDNDYVYRQLLGMTKNEISALRDKGII